MIFLIKRNAVEDSDSDGENDSESEDEAGWGFHIEKRKPKEDKDDVDVDASEFLPSLEYDNYIYYREQLEEHVKEIVEIGGKKSVLNNLNNKTVKFARALENDDIRRKKVFKRIKKYKEKIKDLKHEIRKSFWFELEEFDNYFKNK